jgi:hypothetical protein
LFSEERNRTMTSHIALDGCRNIEAEARDRDDLTPVVIRGFRPGIHIAIWFPIGALPALKKAVRILQKCKAEKMQEVEA